MGAWWQSRVVIAALSAAGAVGVVATIARAHPGHDALALADSNARPGGGASSSSNAPLTNQVEIVTKDGFRYITANGIPNHATGQFPNRNNPNRIAAQEYKFRVTLEPTAHERPTSIRHDLFGVALNGVPFDPGTAEFWNGDRRSIWNYEALTGKMNLGVDQNLAHVQPGGVYHYHGIPAGLIEVLAKSATAPTTQRATGAHAQPQNPREAQGMILVGFAADGFPIYGPYACGDANDASSALRKMKSSYRLKQGERPGGDKGPGGPYDGSFTADFEYVKGWGDLDECNGRTGVTSEYTKGTYYYVLTEDFPFIPRFWRGDPDDSFIKRGGPPGGRGGPAGRGGGLGGPGGGAAGPGGRRPPQPPHER